MQFTGIKFQKKTKGVFRTKKQIKRNFIDE